MIYYHGNKLILINKSATARDSVADIVINDAVGEDTRLLCQGFIDIHYRDQQIQVRDGRQGEIHL